MSRPPEPSKTAENAAGLPGQREGCLLICAWINEAGGRDDLALRIETVIGVSIGTSRQANCDIDEARKRIDRIVAGHSLAAS